MESLAGISPEDVECTFRILKGWWRILKMGIDFKGSK